jgi:phage tail P2-like protein
MTKLYDGQVADLLQNSLKYNPEIQALSYAILQEKRKAMDHANQTRTMAMIDTLPEPVLDVLAVELRTPAYSADLPIQNKRTLIKGTLTFYKMLGTPAAVNWVIQSVFGNGNISEWFDYDGEPHHFRVIVTNDDTFTTLAHLEESMQLINQAKRLSSWMDSIIVFTRSDPVTLHIGGLMASVTRLTLPALADTFNFEGTLHTGGVVTATYQHGLPEVKDTFSFEDTMRVGGVMAATCQQGLPQVQDTFQFTGAVRTGGSMATAQSIPIPARENDITLTQTGRIGVTGAVKTTVHLPELS